MIQEFEAILSALIRPDPATPGSPVVDPVRQFVPNRTDPAGKAQTLNAAFLIALSGKSHPASEEAGRFLSRMTNSPEWGESARFFLRGIRLVCEEIDRVSSEASDFAARLKGLSGETRKPRGAGDTEDFAEKTWSLFFPEGQGIRANREKSIEALREKRIVTITALNPSPINNPAREILFTSNVLLTIPGQSKSTDSLPYTQEITEVLSRTGREPQLYWYDHPIEVGVDPENNEALYGLRGLEAAIDFERERGNIPFGEKGTCLLSVSVTHKGLQNIAKEILEQTLLGQGRLKNIDVYAFTEADAQWIRDDILAPAAVRYLHRKEAAEDLGMLGVDGEYGRHYNFLKAIAPLWSILIQPEVRATFKIDLDQVFPQKELVQETRKSAFEHLETPLWGARGLDSGGHPVELGMIAGALVNERDIGGSLFTADVPFEERPLALDEYIFNSALPQALSTEAEMMTRYNREGLDGKTGCIQRIHVTGGTTGAFVESLRRYRPFTPSFMGRAEDQAYLLSVLGEPGMRLGYVHKDGLIMRHDKESFAREAIHSAYIAKLVGDYVRILYFSAYARVLTDDVKKLKEAVDPFTGCFISRIPLTVVFLRFGLKAASFFAAGDEVQGVEFIKMGARRLTRAVNFSDEKEGLLRETFEKERAGWRLYYDTLTAVEKALRDKDPFALTLQKKAQAIVKTSKIDARSTLLTRTHQFGGEDKC